MEIEEGILEKGIGKDASAQGLGSHHRVEGRIYTKKRKGIFIVKGRKRRDASICKGPIKKKIHPILQVTPNITSILCDKKGWNKENGTRLLTYKPVDNKKWISSASYCEYTRQSRKEKGVHKAGPCEGDQSGVLQEIPQLNYSMEYVTTHLQEIPQRIR